jgi:phosphatidylinositol 4-kinase
VNESFRRALNDQVVLHNIDPIVYTEVKRILVECCRPADQVRSIALRYMDALVNSFPSLLCESSVVTACLEVLTLLRRACESQYDDAVRCLGNFFSVFEILLIMAGEVFTCVPIRVEAGRSFH